MKDIITQRILNKRMAVASWILPLVSLVTISMAGEKSVFARQVPLQARDRAMGYDIVSIATLAMGVALACWCLFVVRKQMPPHHARHAVLGLIVAGLVVGLAMLTSMLQHP